MKIRLELYLFNVFFFLSVYLSWNIAGVQFSCLFTFLADACENPTRLGKK